MKHNVHGISLYQNARSARPVTSEVKRHHRRPEREREDIRVCLNCTREHCTGECADIRFMRK